MNSTVDSRVDAHGPWKVAIFAGEELERVRSTAEPFSQSEIVEHGPLVCAAFVAQIGALAGLTLRESTCQVFSHPTVGVQPHLDLDYILREMVDARTCSSCGGEMTEKESLSQRGLHWIKACRKPPSKPELFTVCINLSRTRMEVLMFGGACSVAHNHVGAVIPVIPRGHHGKGHKKVLLDPGEGVVFSAWVVHSSHPSSLLGDRISLCYRGFSAGPRRTHTLPDVHTNFFLGYTGWALVVIRKSLTFCYQKYVVGAL